MLQYTPQRDHYRGINRHTGMTAKPGKTKQYSCGKSIQYIFFVRFHQQAQNPRNVTDRNYTDCMLGFTKKEPIESEKDGPRIGPCGRHSQPLQQKKKADHATQPMHQPQVLKNLKTPAKKVCRCQGNGIE